MMFTSYFEIIVICLLILIPVLYELSQTFRYFFKFAVYYGGVMLVALFLIPYMVFVSPCDVKHLVTASFFCRRISPILGLKWELRGREHLEKDQAYIIVANHQSSLDILGMFDLWKVMNKCTVVAKHELFYAWPFGLGAWLCGLIFINRNHSATARGTVNAAVDYIKKKNIKLWIFPEGKRHNTNDVHEFKKGAFFSAVDAQIPILPVVFSTYTTFLNDDHKIFTSGDVIVTTLPPIPTEGLTRSDIENLMEKTRNAMLEVYRSSSNEVEDKMKLQIQHGDKAKLARILGHQSADIQSQKSQKTVEVLG